MAGWKYFYYSDTQKLELNALLKELNSFPAYNFAFIIDTAYETNYDRSDLDYLVKTLESDERIIACASSRKIESWLLPLFLLSDLKFCTDNVIFSLSGLGQKGLEQTAKIIGRLCGKSQGMYFFIKNSITSSEFELLGLINSIVNREQLFSFEAYFEEYLSDKDENTMTILKKSLSAPAASGDYLSSFAHERKSFSECFENGAAKKISNYLLNHLRNKS